MLLAAVAALAMQSPVPVYSKDDAGRVAVHATRITTPIKIDGKLDDEIYGQVPALTEFVQSEPNEGAAASERTEAWIMYDDKNLYIACRCWDRNPERIIANDMRRDSPNLRNNDNFAVELDTFHDRRNGFLFYLTPLGALFDGLTTDERSNNSDWNTVWEGKAGRFDGGWVAEIAIPFKSLRYAPGREQIWGVNLRRNIRAKNEWTYIAPLKAAWGQTAIFRVSAAATLDGLEAPPAGKNLEIKPYAISRRSTDLVSRPTVNGKVEPDAGLDVKYGITKSLTADVTVNTDFAQVEEDEAQVNLTRFNLVFPEKREFFLEGAGNFNFGGGNGGLGGVAPPPPGATQGPVSGDAPALFYSRRIGISGTRTVPIRGGGRLTGKTGPWGIGVLNIESDRDDAAAALPTNFTVVRVRRDILRRSTLGGMLTSRSRAVNGVGSNQVWGLDANFSVRQNVYASAFVAQSKTDGRSGDDFSYRGQFNYAADKYGVTLDRIEVQPNFNPEVGFLRRTAFRESVIGGRYSPRPQAKRVSRVVRKYYYDGTYTYITDTRNVLQSSAGIANYRVELQNSDLLQLTYNRNHETLTTPFVISENVRIPTGSYNFHSVMAVYNPGQQHHVSGSGSLEVGSFYDGDKTTAAFRGRISLTPRLAVEPNVSLNWIDLPIKTFTNTVLGQRTLYSMTPRMFLTALVQYSSSTTSLSANIRFRWEYMPGSELFVVYTEGRDTAPVGIMPLENRGFVVKVNKLLRF